MRKLTVTALLLWAAACHTAHTDVEPSRETAGLESGTQATEVVLIVAVDATIDMVWQIQNALIATGIPRVTVATPPH